MPTPMHDNRNIDPRTVEGFGQEWNAYRQDQADKGDRSAVFDVYFCIFPFDRLPADAQGFDLGCGTGRWAALVAPRVGRLHCIDPAKPALDVARQNLSAQSNIEFHHAGVDDIPLDDDSMDFGYSLGVLHHIPDTSAGLQRCTAKLKPGAPFLLYLYYRFDNRPFWFKAVWRASDMLRRGISALPFRARKTVATGLAAALYWPLARSSRLLERLGADVDTLPLSAYRDRSFYTMRTDSLDRFGTRLEHRFTKREIQAMMENAGLERISFSDRFPYWVSVGYRKA